MSLGGRLRSRGLEHARDTVLQLVDALPGRARNLVERKPSPRRLAPEFGDTRRILRHIHLGRNHEHRLSCESFAETPELIEHNSEIIHRIPPARLRGVHQMDQQTRSLHMPQELDAQTVAQVRALDKTGYVGYYEGRIVDTHHAEIWLERSEWIVGDLRPRRRYTRDQSRFPGVRKPDQSHISKQLQLEPQMPLFAGLTGLMLGRCLTRRSGEMLIPTAAPPTPRYREAVARASEVMEHFARIFVVNDRSNGYRQVD